MWKYICAPFAWIMRLFYSLTGSYGLAIILFTLVVKLVLLPFQLKSKKSMLRMNRMQGKIKDIQTRYANDKQRQQEEMAELYAKEGVNPMSGCLWSLIPFPILIALYNIIRQPLGYFMMMSDSAVNGIREMANGLGYAFKNDAYEQIRLAKFVHENWSTFQGKFQGLIDLNYNFLGMDLSEVANTKFNIFPGGGWPVWGLLLLPLIAAASQMVLSVISMRASPSAGSTISRPSRTAISVMIRKNSQPMPTLSSGGQSATESPKNMPPRRPTMITAKKRKYRIVPVLERPVFFLVL